MSWTKSEFEARKHALRSTSLGYPAKVWRAEVPPDQILARFPFWIGTEYIVALDPATPVEMTDQSMAKWSRL